MDVAGRQLLPRKGQNATWKSPEHPPPSFGMSLLHTFKPVPAAAGSGASAAAGAGGAAAAPVDPEEAEAELRAEEDAAVAQRRGEGARLAEDAKRADAASRAANAASGGADAAARNAAGKLQRAQAALKAAAAALDKHRREARRLEDTGPPADADAEAEDLDRAALRGTLDAAREAEEAARAGAKAAADKVARLDAGIAALQKELDALQDAAEAKGVEEAEGAVEAAQGGVAKAAAALEKTRAFVEVQRQKADARQAELAAAEAAATADWQAHAAATGQDGPTDPDITVVRATAERKAAVKKYEEDVKRLSMDPEEAAAALTAYRLAQAAYDIEHAHFEAVRDNIEVLNRQKAELQGAFKNGKRHAAQAVNRHFRNTMAAEGGHRGKVEFLHAEGLAKRSSGAGDFTQDEGELRVLVAADMSQRFASQRPLRDSELAASQAGGGAATQAHAAHDDQALAGMMQDSASLSGGEKSVSTLALLSAIAAMCALPFRAIDEFDVFQDEKNRKRSLERLLREGAGYNEDGRYAQYILLTPHDISSAVDLRKPEIRDLVKTFKLPDAKRAEGAGTGGAAAAGAGARGAASQAAAGAGGAGDDTDEEE